MLGLHHPSPQVGKQAEGLLLGPFFPPSFGLFLPPKCWVG